MAFRIPEGIEKEVDVKELDNVNLERYHDYMHIFWKKVEEGLRDSNFNWTFREIYDLHKQIIIEMIRRKINHIHPINNLDLIPLTNKKELKNLLKSLSKL